ncbi:MAG: ABC transporter permease [Candidatus Abyssubacteria bacterium]
MAFADSRMHFQLGWRNIWRNPRRTGVIMVAIIIGVWSMIFLSALQRGILVAMIENGISTLTGDVKIHARGYRTDPVVENSIADPDPVEAALKKDLPEDATWAARIRVSAIASNARHSGGVTFVGIDPNREQHVSFIGPEAITQGRYLNPDDKYSMVVGEALLEKFETQVGHKLVIMSQDTEKEIASRAFRIIGAFDAEMESTEKQYVFVTRQTAADMLKLGDAISEVSISLTDHDAAERMAEKLRADLPAKCEIMTWRQLLPILEAYLQIFDGFIFIWYIVVFIAMGFGIINTLLMAVFERMREFGLLKALGMKPLWIIQGVLIESFYLLILGIAIGDFLGFLSIWALPERGIDLSALAAGAEYAGMSRMIQPAIFAQDVITANLVVLMLGLLVSLYPGGKAARFTPVEALART